ncbi:MAG: hypothetical protein LBD22_07615 [Spirochaetaceae bacterium]|jgi:hypothetical protein|nr:hypothetical protein [Spirochaetaceae bacterium]
MKNISNLGILVGALVCAVCLTACDAPELADAGPQSSFWVNLNLGTDIKSSYRVARIFLIGANGEKIGSSFGESDGTYKVVIPEKYTKEPQMFTVQFTRQSSFLDAIPGLQQNPMALEMLKSFYFTTPKPTSIPETTGATITLESVEKTDNTTPKPINVEDLKIGFAEQSEDILNNVDNLPPLYKIELKTSKLNEYIQGEGYRPFVGLVTLPNEPLDIDPMILSIDPTKYIGYSGAEEWYLVLNDKTYGEGDTLRIWLIFTSSDPNKFPRVYYKNIVLPDQLGLIVIEPHFAGIPVTESLFKQVLTTIPASGSNPISKYSMLTSAESYVLIASSYNCDDGNWTADGIFRHFRGEFRGAGFKVTNVILDTISTVNMGLFKLTSDQDRKFVDNEYRPAQIEDLNIEIIQVQTGPALASHVGGLVGFASGKSEITNVNVVNVLASGTLSTTSGIYVGGIAGRLSNDASIASCTFAPPLLPLYGSRF